MRLCCALGLALLAGPALGLDYRLELGSETWAFSQAGAQGQARQNLAASARLTLWQEWQDGRDSLTVEPLLRYDAEDPERRQADLRQLDWVHVAGAWEVRAGIRQVFWGVTEGAHLVDIINQTDQVAALDGEDKLGQPMLNLAWEAGAHGLDLYALLGARERTFAGSDGRLRLPLVVDTDQASYESGRGRRRVDSALRYQFNDQGLRLGLSAFQGTAREPELRPVLDPARLVYAQSGQPMGLAPGYTPVLAPHYPLIRQLGLDAQYTAGDALLKAELIRRRGQGPAFWAADLGLEYTQVGLAGLAWDLGYLLEYLHDSRNGQATTPFEHDLLLGGRLALNDVAGSELLAYVIADLHSGEQLWTVEASRRLGESLRLGLEARVFRHTPAPQDAWAFLATPDTEHKLRSLAQDDYLRLSLDWFF